MSDREASLNHEIELRRVIKESINLHPKRIGKGECVGCACNDKVTILLSRSVSSAGRLHTVRRDPFSRTMGTRVRYAQKEEESRERERAGCERAHGYNHEASWWRDTNASHRGPVLYRNGARLPFRVSLSAFSDAFSIVPCIRRNLRKAPNLRR